MIIRAMTSHYRRHPMQLLALALMIVVATMLWTGVSVLTGQARDSLEVSEASVAAQYSVVRDDGQPVTVTDFVALRRAGLCVAPWFETSDGGKQSLIGLDALAMACLASSPGGSQASMEGEPFVDISQVANGKGRLSLLADSGSQTLPPGYDFREFRLGPPTGELADSFLLNLDALSLLVLFITGLLVRSVYQLGLAQRRSSFVLLERFGVSPAQVDRLLMGELVALTLVCVVPGVWLGQVLANRLGRGFGQAMDSLFDVSLYAGVSGPPAWQTVLVMVALVLGVCLADRVLPERALKPKPWLLIMIAVAGLTLVLSAASLIWVFVGTALVFTGLGGLAPGVLARLADGLASRQPQNQRLPLARWRFRELAVMFRNLALPLVALQFAMATVLAVQALVTTFEDTFDTWLGQRLAAQVYVEVPAGAKGQLGAATLSELRGIGDWHWVRRTQAQLPETDSPAPGVTVDVMALAPVTDLVTDWTLLASVERPWAALESGAVMVNEQLARRQGLSLGQRLQYEMDGQSMTGEVAAIYADYGRPSGELLIHGDYLPQGLTPAFQSFSINPGQPSVEGVAGALKAAWQVQDVTIRDNASIQALASQVFQQTFLLTRAISLLTLVLASLSLLVMGWVFFATRARYFDLLGVWGVSDSAIRAELRRLALLLCAGVTVIALPLGVWLTWVLVSRINPLAFGWSLPMAVYPVFWVELVVMMALIGLAIAWLIGRQVRPAVSANPLLGLFFLALVACSETPEPQGFAGLAESVSQDSAHDYLQPGPGDELVFPDDLGPHPQHRIEWWYLTANLQTSDGRPLGLQWTQFRQALKPRPASAPAPAAENWPLEAAWMAHAAVSFSGEHRFAERLARGDVGHAGAVAKPFEVWLDNWLIKDEGASNGWRLTVQADGWGYDLRLTNTDRRIAHGDNGFSAKSYDGQGSMYFSLVDLTIEGTVTLDGRTYDVQGHGWFDREWSSQFLKAGQQGWDWFALHLAGGEKLMAFRLRDQARDFLSGTWVAADGSVTSLGPEQIELVADGWRTSSEGRVPGQFRLRIPGKGVDLRVTAPEGQYWNSGLYPYWESPVTVTGSHRGKGYMELTGYRQ